MDKAIIPNVIQESVLSASKPRGSLIASDLVLEIQGHLRSMNRESFHAAQNRFLNHVRYIFVESFREAATWYLHVFLGGCLIVFASLIKIPLEPVAFTLQTLAIFILGLTQSPKQAFASVLCYLCFATCGLPVLSGSANSLWMLGKSGGYLISFPIAAYLIAWMRSKGFLLSALLCGQAVIFVFGWIGLVPFIGMWSGFVKGVLVFIPSVWCKIVAALVFVKEREL